MIRVPSPAKLNLFLHITGRRENGYHELQTIFQLIDLYDWMTFTPISGDEIQIEGLGEVQLEQNLIYRAAQILRPHAQNPCGLHIKVKKYSDGCWLRWRFFQCSNDAYCLKSIMAMWSN